MMNLGQLLIIFSSFFLMYLAQQKEQKKTFILQVRQEVDRYLNELTHEESKEVENE